MIKKVLAVTIAGTINIRGISRGSTVVAEFDIIASVTT